LMGLNSYGLPIGPFASRVLAEAVLIDVDSALLSDGADFVRWVDDYTIFCTSEVEGQRLLFRLAEHLFNNHGLTLSGMKTKLLSKEVFQERWLREPDQEIEDGLELLMQLAARGDPYSGDEIELTQEEIDHLEGLNLSGLLQEALADSRLVDYE